MFVSLRERVLGHKETFCGAAVPLSLRVFLEGVGDGDGAVAEVLAVHGFDGGIGGLDEMLASKRSRNRKSGNKLSSNEASANKTLTN
jgi:hypothetical protein